MLHRTYSTETVLKATEQYSSEIKGFYPEEWLEDRSNIALVSSGGDVALFERDAPQVVTGHYFFFCRGRDAIALSKEVLDEVFSGSYDVQVIRGLTPLDNKGALWMSSRVGFKSYGDIKTQVGLCRLFILTKQEWEQLNG